MTAIFLQTKPETHSPRPRTIFIMGGWFGMPALKYVGKLTGKPRPTICFVPTAGAENDTRIAKFFQDCVSIDVKPSVLRTFVNSARDKTPFEDIIMAADAIFVGGGNTLNMMAIWKAHGIDKLLCKAYDAGTVMCGASAGSLCWFEAGPSDSRPSKLTNVDCLGWLEGSHCPHYHKEPMRIPSYHEQILGGHLKPGYACDDKAGLIFQNEKLARRLAADQESFSYFVSLKDGEVVEERLPIDEYLATDD